MSRDTLVGPSRAPSPHVLFGDTVVNPCSLIELHVLFEWPWPKSISGPGLIRTFFRKHVMSAFDIFL